MEILHGWEVDAAAADPILIAVAASMPTIVVGFITRVSYYNFLWEMAACEEFATSDDVLAGAPTTLPENLLNAAAYYAPNPPPMNINMFLL